MAEAVGGEQPHILYLDDEDNLVFLVTLSLEQVGYRVSGFTAAAAALEALHADQFDAFVTDQNMPHRSGIEVAAEVARLRPGLPVIVASGHVDERLREQARAAGVAHLIDKPTTVEEFCRALRDAIAAGPRA